jgi:Uma2 family endonuclease
MAYNPGMSSSAAHATYTWNDFIALGDEDKRELIDGELVEVEVPATFSHESMVGYLAGAFHAWRQAHGGRVLSSSYKVRISERRGVMPDLQVFRAGNIPGPDQSTGLTTGHPDLVVEIISPSSRRYDRVTKLRWYAQLGVPEYWIVDPADRTLERLVLRGEHYSIAGMCVDDEIFRPESFEGLEVPLAPLWD